MSDVGLRTGVWLYPGVPADQLVDAVVAAEAHGLDEVWIADEGVGREPTAVLAAAARETSRIRLAVGITSPVLRHPGAIAATAATVDELSGGRFVLGLGVGGHESLDPFGLTADRPVRMLRDAIATARAVLGRRRGDRYDPPAHAFGPRPVPLWVGARGPQLVGLAARVADGVFCSGCTPAEHDRIAEQLATGAVERDDGRRADLAIYRSVAEVRAERLDAWDDVGVALGDELDRLAPAAVGLNLVELARRDGHAPDATGLVMRAAEVLADVLTDARRS